MVVVRLTKFSGFSGSAMSSKRRSVGKHVGFTSVLARAYNWSGVRTVYPPNLPQGEYDFISTMPDPQKALQLEIEKMFKLTAHLEMRETDVLLMKVKNPNAPGRSPASGQGGGMQSSRGEMTWKNQPLSSVGVNLEGYLGVPVLDKTGTDRTFDMTLKWEHDSKDSLRKALLDQSGLELVPARERIEMLVVEKTQ
jgi:uncharacterized protein (TIGR03435 family)